MGENVREQSTIKNPLTVIAIFAGIAEVSGTIVLPLLDSSIQNTFMWFVMGFPCVLVLLFFVTLLFRHEVLYAPSDFRDDASFLNARRRERERAALDEKLQNDFAFAVEAPGTESDTTGQSAPGSSTASPPLTPPAPTPEATRVARGTYLLAEKLVLDKLEREFSGSFDRGSVLIDGDAVFAFDATAHEDDVMTGIEVKYFPSARFNRTLFRNTLSKLDGFYRRMSADARDEFRMILAIATDAPETEHPQIAESIRGLATSSPVPLDIRVYGMKALEAELGAR
jgi:hypothetical protein